MGPDRAGARLEIARPDLPGYGPWAVVVTARAQVGAAFARLLGEAGTNLVLVGPDGAPLRASADACRSPGVEVRTLALDPADDGAVDRLAAATRGLEVGLLVYDPGTAAPDPEPQTTAYLDSDPAQVARRLALDVTVPLALVRHFGAPMRERGRGGIVLVGSLDGYAGQADRAVHDAAKAFARVFIEALWAELDGSGVDVVEVVPGLRGAHPEELARTALTGLARGPMHFVGEPARRS